MRRVDGADRDDLRIVPQQIYERGRDHVAGEKEVRQKNDEHRVKNQLLQASVKAESLH